MTDLTHWAAIHTHILQLEQEGLVTRTFRRLDPERQQVVLSAILDEAVEKGPTNLNIKQVASRAGVAVGSLYQYFGSRDKLLDFAVALCVRYMVDEMNAARPYLTEMPLREGLTTYLTSGIEWSETQVGMIQFFMRAAYQGDPELGERVVKPVADVLRETIGAMLAAAVERGEIRPDADLDAMTRLVYGLTILIGDSQLLPYLNTYFQTTADDLPLERILAAFTELIFRGIGMA